MKRYLLFLSRYVLGWVSFFLLYRITFYFFYSEKLSGNSLAFNLRALYKGSRLDFATICYFLVITLLLVLLQQFVKRDLYKVFIWVNSLFIILGSIIFSSNLLLYRQWQTPLNRRAISFLEYPSQVLASVSISDITWFLALTLMFTVIGYLIFKKLTENFWFKQNKIILQISPMLFIPISLIGIRGGWQQIPVNESSAYYCSVAVNNHLALNPVWYLGNNLFTFNKKSDFIFPISRDEQALHFKSLFEKKGSHQSWLKSKDPNIVIIILEGFTGELVPYLKGEPVATFLDSLSEKGIRFTNVYSSGFRTDQGIPSIIAGFPAIPNQSLLKMVSKTEKLVTLPKILTHRKYSSSFFYGGEIGFKNLGSFLSTGGFEYISSIDDYKFDQINSKWGADDQYVFEKHGEYLSKQKQPFFSVLLTLSNHEPFIVPVKYSNFSSNSDADKFRTTAKYTDECLRSYFKQIQNTTWYKNTLFVFVADHGHRLPSDKSLEWPDGRRIPLVLFGDVISKEFVGRTINSLGNHHDLPATLCEALEIKNEFKWSRDLLSTYKVPFAFLANDYGMVWMDSLTAHPYFKGIPDQEKAPIEGKAYMNELLDEFNRL